MMRAPCRCRPARRRRHGVERARHRKDWRGNMRRSVRAVLACCALSVVLVAAGALAGPASTGRNARDAAGPGRAGSGIRGSLGAILHAEAECTEDGTPEYWVPAQRSSGGTPSIRAFNEASNESAAIGRETRQTAPK